MNFIKKNTISNIYNYFFEYMTSIDWSTYSAKGYLNEEDLCKRTEAYSNFLNAYGVCNFHKFNVLEFGAGHGLNTILFSRLFKKILALEPNVKLYSELSNKIKKDGLSHKIKTQQTDVDSFETNHKFDIIILANVFLFIKNKQNTLSKFSSLLKENKYLLIIEPLKFFNYKSSNKLLMQESLIVINKTKKFELIFTGILDFGSWIYLLKLIS